MLDSPLSRRSLLVLLAAAATVWPHAASAQTATADAPTAESLAGLWGGTLDVSVAKLRLRFDLKTENGTLGGELISVDQGNAKIPIGVVDLQGRQIMMTVPMAAGSYKGEVAADGESLDGTWSQGGQSFPLKLTRVAAGDDRRPQDPQPPLPYDSEEVTFPGGADGVTLAGTITRPRGEGKRPAVALLSGSGPQDRDEALMGHRPFLVLADALTRRGIVVLRFDDRGVGESTGAFGEAGVSDFVEDAKAAVAFLASADGVDPERIGIVGHSEGALVGARAAVEEPRIAYLVMLAGPGVPLSDLLVRQTEDLTRELGKTDAEIAEAVAQQREALRLLSLVESPDDDAASAYREYLISLSDSDEDRDTLTARAEASLQPWLRELIAQRPAEAIERLRIPILALNGEKDIQVKADENLAAIAAAAQAAGNDRVVTQKLPGLNHLFQTAETGSVSEYAEIDETMSPAVLERVADWILETAGE